MKNIANLILSALIFISCGQYEAKCPQDQTKCEKEKVETIKEVKYFYLNGSVVGAFEISVDGQNYADIEEFYSKENARLNQRVIEAGYKGYTAKLEGKIGFRDLTDGMSVFVAPTDKRGYAAKTVIAYNDTFSIRFPEEAANDVYKVRATKRINVKLTKAVADPVPSPTPTVTPVPSPDQGTALADVTKTLCYNFSAIDVAVSYEEVNKPVILSTFETKLTDYACEDVKPSETLEIPNAE